jgi:hypothetical protein
MFLCTPSLFLYPQFRPAAPTGTSSTPAARCSPRTSAHTPPYAVVSASDLRFVVCRHKNLEGRIERKVFPVQGACRKFVLSRDLLYERLAAT